MPDDEALVCQCGGQVGWVLTEEFDGDVFSLECWGCGADFSDPSEEFVIEGDDIRRQRRAPELMQAPTPGP